MPVAQKLPSTAWPDGSTWVFQGTIAEDATAGTHVCTLTVTPGVGNEMRVIGGEITTGNTATATVVRARVTDGTNNLFDYLLGASTTTANSQFAFPTVNLTASGQTGFFGGNPNEPFVISGNMTLILSATTAAVSVTQTFALVCRLRSPKKPTATLLDTIGTSTNTVNTNAIFG